MYTIQVHNHKDDPLRETTSLHGEYGSPATAAAILEATLNRQRANEVLDFLTFEVVEIGAMDLESIVAIHAPGFWPVGARPASALDIPSEV